MKKVLIAVLFISILANIYSAEKEIKKDTKTKFNFSEPQIILAQATAPADTPKTDSVESTQKTEEKKESENKTEPKKETKKASKVSDATMYTLGLNLGNSASGLLVTTWALYLITALALPLALAKSFNTPADMWDRYIYPAIGTSWIPVGGPIAGAVILFDMCNDKRVYFALSDETNKTMYQSIGAVFIVTSVIQIISIAMMISGYTFAIYYKPKKAKKISFNDFKFDLGIGTDKNKKIEINSTLRILL